MKKENLKTLIDVLKQSGTFDMTQYYKPECGSPACIAGHVQSIMNVVNFTCMIDLTKDFLGVSKGQALSIVSPKFLHADFRFEGHITKAHAIQMLERLLETGLVDWQKSKEDLKSKERTEKFDMKDFLKKIESETNKTPGESYDLQPQNH